MKLKIETWMNSDCTIGRLSYGAFRCLTLELPWYSNSRNISCIPPGVYDAIKYDSPTKGPVILLKGVPNRTWIQIHAGNYTRQIQGCMLVGVSLTYLDKDDILDVTNSKNTLQALMALLPDDFEVEITRT